MTELLSQLEAGLRRHAAKPHDPGRVIYEDERIVQILHERRGGNHILQLNKPRPGATYAFLVLPAK
jgi:hypothetical protein